MSNLDDIGKIWRGVKKDNTSWLDGYIKWIGNTPMQIYQTLSHFNDDIQSLIPDAIGLMKEIVNICKKIDNPKARNWKFPGSVDSSTLHDAVQCVIKFLQTIQYEDINMDQAEKLRFLRSIATVFMNKTSISVGETMNEADLWTYIYIALASVSPPILTNALSKMAIARLFTQCNTELINLLIDHIRNRIAESAIDGNSGQILIDILYYIAGTSEVTRNMLGTTISQVDDVLGADFTGTTIKEIIEGVTDKGEHTAESVMNLLLFSTGISGLIEKVSEIDKTLGKSLRDFQLTQPGMTRDLLLMVEDAIESVSSSITPEQRQAIDLLMRRIMNLDSSIIGAGPYVLCDDSGRSISGGAPITILQPEMEPVLREMTRPRRHDGIARYHRQYQQLYDNLLTAIHAYTHLYTKHIRNVKSNSEVRAQQEILIDEMHSYTPRMITRVMATIRTTSRYNPGEFLKLISFAYKTTNMKDIIEELIKKAQTVYPKELIEALKKTLYHLNAIIKALENINEHGYLKNELGQMEQAYMVLRGGAQKNKKLKVKKVIVHTTKTGSTIKNSKPKSKKSKSKSKSKSKVKPKPKVKTISIASAKKQTVVRPQTDRTMLSEFSYDSGLWAHEDGLPVNSMHVIAGGNPQPGDLLFMLDSILSPKYKQKFTPNVIAKQRPTGGMMKLGIDKRKKSKKKKKIKGGGFADILGEVNSEVGNAGTKLKSMLGGILGGMPRKVRQQQQVPHAISKKQPSHPQNLQQQSDSPDDNDYDNNESPFEFDTDTSDSDTSEYDSDDNYNQVDLFDDMYILGGAPINTVTTATLADRLQSAIEKDRALSNIKHIKDMIAGDHVEQTTIMLEAMKGWIEHINTLLNAPVPADYTAELKTIRDLQLTHIKKGLRAFPMHMDFTREYKLIIESIISQNITDIDTPVIGTGIQYDELLIEDLLQIIGMQTFIVDKIHHSLEQAVKTVVTTEPHMHEDEAPDHVSARGSQDDPVMFNAGAPLMPAKVIEYIKTAPQKSLQELQKILVTNMDTFHKKYHVDTTKATRLCIEMIGAYTHLWNACTVVIARNALQIVDPGAPNLTNTRTPVVGAASNIICLKMFHNIDRGGQAHHTFPSTNQSIFGYLTGSSPFSGVHDVAAAAPQQNVPNPTIVINLIGPNPYTSITTPQVYLARQGMLNVDTYAESTIMPLLPMLKECMSAISHSMCSPIMYKSLLMTYDRSEKEDKRLISMYMSIIGGGPEDKPKAVTKNMTVTDLRVGAPGERIQIDPDVFEQIFDEKSPFISEILDKDYSKWCQTLQSIATIFGERRVKAIASRASGQDKVVSGGAPIDRIRSLLATATEAPSKVGMQLDIPSSALRICMIAMHTLHKIITLISDCVLEIQNVYKNPNMMVLFAENKTSPFSPVIKALQRHIQSQNMAIHKTDSTVVEITRDLFWTILKELLKIYDAYYKNDDTRFLHGLVRYIFASISMGRMSRDMLVDIMSSDDIYETGGKVNPFSTANDTYGSNLLTLHEKSVYSLGTGEGLLTESSGLDAIQKMLKEEHRQLRPSIEMIEITRMLVEKMGDFSSELVGYNKPIVNELLKEYINIKNRKSPDSGIMLYRSFINNSKETNNPGMAADEDVMLYILLDALAIQSDLIHRISGAIVFATGFFALELARDYVTRIQLGPTAIFNHQAFMQSFQVVTKKYPMIPSMEHHAWNQLNKWVFNGFEGLFPTISHNGFNIGLYDSLIGHLCTFVTQCSKMTTVTKEKLYQHLLLVWPIDGLMIILCKHLAGISCHQDTKSTYGCISYHPLDVIPFDFTTYMETFTVMVGYVEPLWEVHKVRTPLTDRKNNAVIEKLFELPKILLHKTPGEYKTQMHLLTKLFGEAYTKLGTRMTATSSVPNFVAQASKIIDFVDSQLILAYELLPGILMSKENGMVPGISMSTEDSISKLLYYEGPTTGYSAGKLVVSTALMSRLPFYNISSINPFDEVITDGIRTTFEQLSQIIANIIYSTIVPELQSRFFLLRPILNILKDLFMKHGKGGYYPDFMPSLISLSDITEGMILRPGDKLVLTNNITIYPASSPHTEVANAPNGYIMKLLHHTQNNGDKVSLGAPAEGVVIPESLAYYLGNLLRLCDEKDSNIGLPIVTPINNIQSLPTDARANIYSVMVSAAAALENTRRLLEIDLLINDKIAIRGATPIPGVLNIKKTVLLPHLHAPAGMSFTELLPLPVHRKDMKSLINSTITGQQDLCNDMIDSVNNIISMLNVPSYAGKINFKKDIEKCSVPVGIKHMYTMTTGLMELCNSTEILPGEAIKIDIDFKVGYCVAGTQNMGQSVFTPGDSKGMLVNLSNMGIISEKLQNRHKKITDTVDKINDFLSTIERIRVELSLVQRLYTVQFDNGPPPIDYAAIVDPNDFLLGMAISTVRWPNTTQGLREMIRNNPGLVSDLLRYANMLMLRLDKIEQDNTSSSNVWIQEPNPRPPQVIVNQVVAIPDVFCILREPNLSLASVRTFMLSIYSIDNILNNVDEIWRSLGGNNTDYIREYLKSSGLVLSMPIVTNSYAPTLQVMNKTDYSHIGPLDVTPVTLTAPVIIDKNKVGRLRMCAITPILESTLHKKTGTNPITIKQSFVADIKLIAPQQTGNSTTIAECLMNVLTTNVLAALSAQHTRCGFGQVPTVNVGRATHVSRPTTISTIEQRIGEYPIQGMLIGESITQSNLGDKVVIYAIHEYGMLEIFKLSSMVHIIPLGGMLLINAASVTQFMMGWLGLNPKDTGSTMSKMLYSSDAFAFSEITETLLQMLLAPPSEFKHTSYLIRSIAFGLFEILATKRAPGTVGDNTIYPYTFTNFAKLPTGTNMYWLHPKTLERTVVVNTNGCSRNRSRVFSSLFMDLINTSYVRHLMHRSMQFLIINQMQLHYHLNRITEDNIDTAPIFR